jgi:Domain of unknown function (DUF4129)
MNVGRIARAFALACLFIVAVPTTSNAATPAARQPDAVVQTDVPAMRAAAAALDRAAVLRKVPTGPVAAGFPPAIGAWLSAGLADARKEKKASNRAADLRALAASLREGASLAERRHVTTPTDLHADVRQVLAESAFHANVTAAPAKKREQSWLGRVLQAFSDWWSKVMGRAIDAAAGTPFLGNIFAFILITAAALALAFLVFRIAMTFVARRARASGSIVAGTPLTATASADETYADACAAARSGAYGLAIALAFQAALLALDRSGRVPYDSARTAGEYRRAVRRSVVAAAASFETLARAFTYVAYAQAPAGESDWRAADAAYASVSATAAERR